MARWILPAFLLLLLVPFGQSIDLSLSALFYSPETGWPAYPPARWGFYVGEYPALLTAFVAMFVLVFSWWGGRRGRRRTRAEVLLLTLVIGAGLIVNLFFKEHWGRLRPRQIEQFGGDGEYRPFYFPLLSGEGGKSFPSGHASMGFYFLVLTAIGLREKKKLLVRSGLLLGMGLGLFLSWARIAEGAHFFTDCAASFCIMWWVALLVTSFSYSRELEV